MKKKHSTESTIDLSASEISLRRASLRLLGGGRDKYLAHLGFRNLRDLLDYEPVLSARTLDAVSRGLIPRSQLAGLVKEEFVQKDAAEALSWPVTALHHVGNAEARVFASLGVTTIADLAVLAKEADEAILAAMTDNGFRERPSAPAQLLPSIIGSVSSSVRLTTFVREGELRKLTFRINPACAVPLAVSTNLKYPGTLGEIFEQQKCPVLHLGYMAAHHQRWINLGTHLGEVVHSISLAPGESRNIALVNWRRRQLTALEERTTTSERLTATFIQNRALKEITTAVAREHQAGRTQTEANTDMTAASFVAAGGVVGGIAGGVAGAVVGGLSGLAVDVLLMGGDAGAGTIMGTIGGGMAGAAVGGAAGMAAGGMVYSGAQALGMIEADTNGDRQIVADVHQRISLSTSQTASAVRSLWSTVVVEDAQAEDVDVQTSNITNYNHMHALNIQYYEVLQHYLTRIELEKVQPILFLPFTFLDFTNFRFIRDYWEAVRPHIDDEGLRSQGDSYFVTEGPPEAPDLLPLPPVPAPPGDTGNLTVTNLKIDVIFKAGDGLAGMFGNLISDIDLEILRGQNSLLPNPVDGEPIDQSQLNVDEKGKRFTFATTISNAADISKIRLVRSQLFNTELRYRVRVHRGAIKSGSTTLETLDGQNIVSQRKIAADSQALTFDHSWSPASSALSVSAAAIEQYNQAVAARNEIIAENTRRLAAYEALVNNIARFKERLQRLVLRRRHFFTRVILNAIEPEEIIQLLEALRIGHVDAASPNFGIPLSDIAHTIPLGMTAGGFVLKLKRIDRQCLLALAKKIGMDKEIEELMRLLQYADHVLRFFADDKLKDSMARTDHIYVPTGGLFAEAILGRSNSAEYLDMERYFNWQDSPIPHQAPTIQPLGTDTRFQPGNVSVNVPEGNLQVINPVSLPDPTGLQSVLTAIQNPNLFRDMSKANELAGIIGSLSTLAGQMGQAASNMTGQAAQQALQSATEVGKAAAQMAQALMNQAFTQTGDAFNTLTSQGAALNQAAKLDDVGAEASSGGGVDEPGGSNGPGAIPHGQMQTLQVETFRRMAGLNGVVLARGPGAGFLPPDLTVPLEQVSPFLWKDLIEFQVPQDVLVLLGNRGMSSLSLAGAFGVLLNLDYFPIRITRLPVVDGEQLTADQLLEHIRRNLHTNLMISTALGQFSPFATEDETIWFSDNPYKSVLRIDLLGPDNAAVVCARAAADHWVFHTVATPDTGAHPVSGQRMFGYFSPTPGEFVFFTRGADRATGVFDALVSEQIFGAGAAIWATFQAGIAGFVNSKGGEATVPRAFSGRYSWFNVIDALKAQTTTITTI